MKTTIDIVPKWVRIFLGLFALANIAFGISGYFSASALFQNNSIGIDLTGFAAKYASYEFAARNLAIGLALMIVSQKGVPESIAIVTIIRALIELQTIIIAGATNNFGMGTAVAAIFLLLEIFIVKTIAGIIAKRNIQQSN